MRPQKKQVAKVGAHAQVASCCSVGVGEKSGPAGGLREEVKSILVGDGVGRGDAQKMRAWGGWQKWEREEQVGVEALLVSGVAGGGGKVGHSPCPSA